MKRKAIFIAATGQNVGKTTLCLGLLSGMQRKYGKVGFIKPVGQEHIETEDGGHADKDVVLFKSHFQLMNQYEQMSPVLFPKGFTRDYLDEKVELPKLRQKIQSAFHSIYDKYPFTIVEGTGHMGVGSICDLNNAEVAKLLNLQVILVASGGLGSSYDQLMLNKSLCDLYKVPISGVILNRVIDDKREMIINYMNKALKKWNIPLLGSIPYNQFLNTPSMQDFEQLFNTKLIAGKMHKMRHFQKTRLIAASLDTYRKLLDNNQLIITPASREDIILVTLTHYWEHQIHYPNQKHEVGIILTGKPPPSKSIIEQLQKAEIPTLYTPCSSYETMKKITSHTAKIKKDDHEKINKAIDVVENHIDFDLLCSQLDN